MAVRSVHDITFGITGQTLYFDAPEGRPSSVTSAKIFPYDVGDAQDSEWTPTTAVESDPATTLDGAAGPSQSNPRNVPLTATTGATVGRTYLITGASGLKEWAEVESATSADSVTVRHPLHNDYATGASFQSTRITATVDSTWVADTGNFRDDAGPNPMYRVRWVYVVSSVTYVHDSYFSLVRYAGSHGVLPQNVDSIVPGWMDSLPTDHYRNQGRTLIDDAYKAVKLQLHGIWTDDAMVANTDIVDELTRYKAVELGEFAKIMAGADRGEQYRVAKDAYQTHFDALKRITDKTPTRTVDGAAAQRTAIGISRR